MTGLLPDELSEELSPFISGELLNAEEKRLLKAADRLSALIKCTEEQLSLIHISLCLRPHQRSEHPFPHHDRPGEHDQSGADL